MDKTLYILVRIQARNYNPKTLKLMKTLLVILTTEKGLSNLENARKDILNYLGNPEDEGVVNAICIEGTLSAEKKRALIDKLNESYNDQISVIFIEMSREDLNTFDSDILTVSL